MVQLELSRTYMFSDVGQEHKGIHPFIKNKYHQNLINLCNNTGSLPNGFVNKPPAALPTNIQAHFNRCPISISPPGQNFLIDFLISLSCCSAGSSDLWVPSTSCISSACSSKKHTLTPLPPPLPNYTDTVTVASITASNQMFSPIFTLSSDFEDDPSNGILSLTFPAISNLHADPFFFTASKQGGTVASNKFGLYLTSTGSELYLGGTNFTHYLGQIKYYCGINLSTRFWQTTGGSISDGSSIMISNFDTITDSGTNIMYGLPSAVQQFYNFNLRPTLPGSSQCIGALSGQDFGLGDSFVENVYTTFNFDQNAVGFAHLA
ncbi:hypothetical protein GYMLUDRAFT_78611 [Collybiopsis luxurians FD-317 M1]|uniref:Peptidase A1 domain-containing protein n=1 Tax=Collybiopsis luxurians FD-317 M1 TaxID=944289 RepID=A0A0D0BWC4_9AGAR|nr:hypothetical protein GYMLUDRAFT_78611 [Collybiopsis luxurians FD-317 M1]